MAIRHVVVLLGLVSVEAIVLSGKALYCRDPDTGKLHALNSTWPSSTFCGNYTCKLRKRNTEIDYSPIRQLNITNINNETSTDNITVTIEERTEPEIEKVIHKDKTLEDDSVEVNRDTQKKTENKAEEVTRMNIASQKKTDDKTEEVTRITSNMAKDRDDENRYLTEKEIKSISEALQTVKKSDLDAIVDIYNLAQDIYNEMDKATNEGDVDDTINAIAHERIHKQSKKSYWYDPLAYKGRQDMDYQGSNHAITTAQPKRDAPTYFNGALTNQDFGKLPYYYPMSSFQRSSSYVHQPTLPTKVERAPCKAKQIKDMQVAAQNLNKPTYLLPYPFAYIHLYNYTDYPIYFNNNPYSWNYYNSQRQYQPYYNAYTAQVPNVPNVANAVLVNPHLHEDVIDIEQKTFEDKDLLGKVLIKTKENLIPDWKTEQLSSQILDEVRANIDTSKLLKAFPFRKKLKLEKVGKLIKLDELTRSRRSADEAVETEIVKEEDEVKINEEKLEVKINEEKLKEVTEDPTAEEEGEYETYLERTTCQTQVIPGYFRYGNLTQPYPQCCPQMINSS